MIGISGNKALAVAVRRMMEELVSHANLLTSSLVIVKALARLLSDPSSIDHSNQQPSRSILAIPRFIMQNPLDAQTSVQSNQIGKRKWTHWMTHT
jgi:hypothetical protein